MPDIADSCCWSAAYELIVKGEIEKAVAICESEPCAMILECQKFLGWTYYNKKNFEAALKWFGKAAEQGSAEAMFGMGSVHFACEDYLAAIECFQRAADNGHGRACHWLGYIYHDGRGVPRNDETAVNWYKRGADQGYLVAERGLIYLTNLHGGIITRIRTFPHYISIILKVLVIGFRNIHDDRLIDAPNAFEKKPHL